MIQKVLKKKKELRLKRKLRIREKCSGTEQKPRISVFRSNKYFYAQAIDDIKSSTLACIDGRKMGLKNTKEDSKKLGVAFGKILLDKNLKDVIFDRNGYLYHGVVASFAEGLRESGVAL